MTQAEKEYKKTSKKEIKKEVKVPVWFNNQPQKEEELPDEEKKALESLLGRFE